MLLAYRDFECGGLSRKQFEDKLQRDYSITLTSDFHKVMSDDRRSYLSLLKSLHISTRRLAEPVVNYYESPQNGKVRTSTELTTATTKGRLPSNRQVTVERLSSCTKDFLDGKISSSGYLDTLRANNVPLTPQIQRSIREHETSQSVQFRSLGQAVLTAIK
jgi:hypothetical protein